MRLKLFIITCLLFTTNLLFAQNKLASDYDYKMMGASIPNFEIKTMEGKIMSNKDFESYEHIIFIIFNPSCDHCHDLTKAVINTINSFKHTAILFIGGNGMEAYFPKFIEETGFEKIKSKPFVFIGSDQTQKTSKSPNLSEFLLNIFEFKLPQVNIYNKDRNMIYKNLGEGDIQKIINALSDNKN